MTAQDTGPKGHLERKLTLMLTLISSMVSWRVPGFGRQRDWLGPHSQEREAKSLGEWRQSQAT